MNPNNAEKHTLLNDKSRGQVPGPSSGDAEENFQNCHYSSEDHTVRMADWLRIKCSRL
jgi:hypothetical protein